MKKPCKYYGLTHHYWWLLVQTTIHFKSFVWQIQLVEGERKAIFEDCEAEKSDNKERIKKLKDEVKDLQNELQSSDKSSEGILNQVQDKKTLDTKVLKRKSGDEAVLTLDYKVRF